jgi:hypothetical protein
MIRRVDDYSYVVHVVCGYQCVVCIRGFVLAKGSSQSRTHGDNPAIECKELVHRTKDALRVLQCSVRGQYTRRLWSDNIFEEDMRDSLRLLKPIPIILNPTLNIAVENIRPFVPPHPDLEEVVSLDI